MSLKECGDRLLGIEDQRVLFMLDCDTQRVYRLLH